MFRQGRAASTSWNNSPQAPAQRRLPSVRFLGTGGRYAVRLASGARITLRELEVGWWRPDRADNIVIDIQFADEVTLEGDPMARWFEGDPTVRGAVEVNMETARHTESHRAPGDKEVKVTFTGSTQTSITLRAP